MYPGWHRTHRHKLTILIAVIPLLIAPACQAARGLLPQATPPQLHHNPQALVRATNTSPPTATTTPSATASPTLTATITPSSTPAPSHPAQQKQTFEQLWRIVKDEYLYPDFNGLDWDAIHQEYNQLIDSGISDPTFYRAMEEMIYRLEDDHSAYLSPSEASSEENEFAGKNDYVGIGILSSLVMERDRMAIIVVFPGSPADRAGLEPHDSILAVNGKPIVDQDGFHNDLLHGAVNTSLEITVQSPGQPPRQVNLRLQRVTGAVPVEQSTLYTVEGKRIGYLLIPTFGDDTVDDQVAEIIRSLTAADPLDGLILDNRQNNGGADTVASQILGYFASGVAGHFVDRDDHRRAMRVLGSDINGSMKIPLVVLIGPDTVSFGEIFSGVLQDMGRAYLIGETTEGNIELLWGYDFEDGSRAWIARETFRPQQHPDQDWESTGVIPDLTIPVNWDEVTLESDPAIRAALSYFDKQSAYKP